MPEADDDAARRELESKLSGLERLRLSGLVTDDRYQAMRAKLVADAGGELPAPVAPSPQAEPPAPAAPVASSAPTGFAPAPSAPAPPPRFPLFAIVATAVVLLAAAGAAAFALAGHNSSQPATTAANSTPPPNAQPTATPVPTPDLNAFGQDYVTDIAPLNKAWADFNAALANAPAGAACGCPPGEFSVQSVLPAFDGLLSTYPQVIRNLQTIQQELTGQPAADTRDLIQDMQVTDNALQKLFQRGASTDLQLAAFDQVDHAQGNEFGAAAKLRIDLGLPMATPAA